ncbi:hypothetical protein HOLleu_31256 [Holothuria leucospilota]|uniref:Ig-like domain-containing protein n=1 Tax=Holothuria leucospilota TaxID=206669 RepID=A0A9Q0YQ10_HOLLE|nr:hypothetical protein HOLleu_31256 [Holothuria leucospilota]
MWKGRNGVKVPIISRSGDGSLSHEFQLREEDRNRPYTCTPSDTYPDVNNCTVIPLLHHTIDITPRQATTELGGRARFSCETRGSPPFNQFKWIIGFGRKNVLKLTENSGRYIVSTNGVSGRLTITNVINSDNNTAVRCQATNSLGEKLNAQASVFISPGPRTSVADVPPITTPSNRDNAVDKPKVTSSSTPSVEDNLGDFVTSGQGFGNGNNADEQGSSVISTGKTSKERPNTSTAGTIIGILLAILILLVLVAIILLYVRRAQGKPAPKMLKRLSVNRPLLLKRFSVNKPRFLKRVSLSKGVESTQNTIEVVHRRISTLKNSSVDADKRSSLRETEIEVVVNPPPPEWQFRKVEDIEKIKRHRLISKHAPSGDYSHKEIDLLHSLVTGSVKMKTLDMVEARDAFRDESDDDADSQFESDFEEDEFDEPMSDSGNQAIDPSPKAPPRRKRNRKAHRSTHPGDNVTVTMEAESLTSNCFQLRDGKPDNSVKDKCIKEPVYDSVPVENVPEPEGAPTYAVVDRKSKDEKS